MTDFKVNGDANGSTHIAGNGVQWRRADEIWSIVADPGVPDDPETTCQDILDSVDGKMTLQWFQAAADHNSAADTAAVQANWAVPQAALGSGSHTYLSEAGFASLLSKLTAQGYPTINDTARNNQNAVTKIINSTFNTINNFYPTSDANTAELFLFSGSLYMPCSVANGASISFRLKASGSKHEGIIYLWQGSAPGAIGTESHVAYAREESGDAPHEVRTEATMLINPGDRVGIVCALYDARLGLNSLMEINIDGAGWQDFRTSADIAATGIGMNSI